MKLIGLMPVRNEAWCLGLTLRAALQRCDAVVVLLHACTDESERIAYQIADECERVKLLHVMGEWDEMVHRQYMLEMARGEGATHIAIVDADEILTGCELPSIKMDVLSTPHGCCLQLPLYNLRGSLDRYHSNGIWGNRWLSVAFKDDPQLSWTGDRFHAREPEYPRGRKLRPYQPIKHGQSGVMHLWGVSERRLAAKHALYKVTERLRWPGRSLREIEDMYNLWRSPEDCAMTYPHMPEWGKPWTYADVPAEWWTPYKGFIKQTEIDYSIRGDGSELLWQEAEVQRLVAEHGADTFRGLDLFGCDKLAPNAPLAVDPTSQALPSSLKP